MGDRAEIDAFDGESRHQVIPETGNVLANTSSRVSLPPVAVESFADYEPSELVPFDDPLSERTRIEDLIGDMRTGVSRGLETFEALLRDEYRLFQRKLAQEKAVFEHYKQKLREVNKIQQSRVNLNVGGVKYTVSLATLTKERDGFLAAMFSGLYKLTLDENGYYFIDRDGNHFSMILTYLRDGIIDPRAQNDPIQREYLEREAQYFQLTGLLNLLNGGAPFSHGDGLETHYSCFFDMSIEPRVQTLEGHEQAVKCLQFLGDILVTGAYDRTFKVWSISKGSLIRTVQTEAVWCLQFAGPDRLCTGHGDNCIRVWDTTTWTCVRVLKGHAATVMCLQCEGNLVCSGSWDNTLRLWNLDNAPGEELVTTFTGHTKAIWCLQFKDNIVVSGSEDKTVRVWDMKTGLCIRVLQGHNGIIRCVQIQGHMLYSGGDDKTIKEWDLEQGFCARTLHHHTKTVRCLQTRDKVMASGSYDFTIKLWDTVTGRCMRTLSGHSGYVTSLQFRDGLLISGSEDKTIKVWKFGSQRPSLSWSSS